MWYKLHINYFYTYNFQGIVLLIFATFEWLVNDENTDSFYSVQVFLTVKNYNQWNRSSKYMLTILRKKSEMTARAPDGPSIRNNFTHPLLGKINDLEGNQLPTYNDVFDVYCVMKVRATDWAKNIHLLKKYWWNLQKRYTVFITQHLNCVWVVIESFYYFWSVTIIQKLFEI